MAMNHEENPATTPHAELPPHAQTPETKRTWRSEELLQAQDEVLIVHGEQVYRLRQTRNGKLILCK
jgi:hemin uptake protein HemP